MQKAYWPIALEFLPSKGLLLTPVTLCVTDESFYLLVKTNRQQLQSRDIAKQDRNLLASQSDANRQELQSKNQQAYAGRDRNPNLLRW